MDTKTILRVIEGAKTVEEAAVSLLAENSGVKVGSNVAIVFDPTYPEAGINGKVKAITGGYADVELPDGRVQKYQVNLLFPL